MNPLDSIVQLFDMQNFNWPASAILQEQQVHVSNPPAASAQFLSMAT
jgi:hypothetical protein